MREYTSKKLISVMQYLQFRYLKRQLGMGQKLVYIPGEHLNIAGTLWKAHAAKTCIYIGIDPGI